MKINVTENKVSIKEEQILNENEYNIHKIQFDFSSEYTDDLVKVALFSIDNHTYKKIISNNECDIPPEVLTQRGYSILGVYAYKTEQDTLVLRYSPSPTKISVYDGSYKADAENSEPITPSEIEQYQQILQNSLQQFQNQYNALVEETEGDIQAIEDELQRKVDEGYFDGEDGFSPIAKVIQKSNGATIEIEDKNGKTTADVLNGEDGYTPVRGVDYWTEEDKQEVEEEATQQIEGKIEEYNENAAEKLNQYNQNSVQKTNDYNTNAEQKMSTYNTNASSKLSEYNSNAETKKSAYDENATQKTNSFNTNATNKLTEYNTNHTEKMSAYNSNSTQKLNAFNENATQKTEDFDEHTEEIQDNIETLEAQNERLRNTLPTTTGEGQDITLNKTAELEFKKPPLPMGNSEQESTTGKNLFNGNDVSTTASSNWSISFENETLTIVHKNTYFTGTPFLNLGVLPQGTYVISGTFNAVSLYKDNIYTSVLNNGNTFTADGASNYDLFFGNSNASTLTYEKMMIRSSSITDNTYEPYTGGEASPSPDYPQEITNVTGDVEVVVENKNLLPILPAQSKTLNGITLTSNGDGSYSVKGTATQSGTILFDINNVKLPNNTIYLHIRNNITAGIGMQIQTSKGVTSPSFSTLNRIFNSPIFTDAIITKIGFYFSENTTIDTTFIPSFELSNNISDYVEHKEQTLPLTLGNIELCKIGDYQDYFYKESNKWYLHKEIDKYVFTGTENWSSVPYGVNSWVRISTISTNYDTARVCAISNIFKGISNDDRATSENNIMYFGGDKNSLFIRNTELTTLADVRTATNGNYIYYILETPTDTEITDTTLISQLEAINNAYSYDEVTIITGSSDGNKPFFIVQAYKDLNKELNNKVDKVQGKELSSNDFTDTLKEKLEGLENYDDTEIKADISGKQDITDNTLTTINKTVPTAINEVNSIAKLANQAKSYSTYQAFINYLNTAEKTEFIPGQSFMIQTKLVPDLWVYSVENTSVQYTYTTDEDFITYTNQATGGQVGHYKLAQLETQKVDLTDYATKTYVNNLFNSIVDGDEVSY